MRVEGGHHEVDEFSFLEVELGRRLEDVRAEAVEVALGITCLTVR